jgi:teichuronic acid biosynthesis glycosyltransferase TuaH
VYGIAAALEPAGSSGGSESNSRDVVFAFFGTAWSGAVNRDFVMPEDRLAVALLEHPDVPRVLVCSPYRSVVGRTRAALGRGHTPEAPFPASADRRHYEPLRLRRSDPVDPRRSIAAYERGIRAASERMGLTAPALITTNPLLAGFGSFDWAGPVTYYAWDDWTASEPHRRHWQAYRDAFQGIRDTGRRVCAISTDALDAIAPTGPGVVVPNGIEPREWDPPGDAPAWLLSQASPRLLYVGALGTRVDVVQARAVAEAYPGGSLTFVGWWEDEAHFEPLLDLPNVSFVTRRPRSEITGAIAAADACLIPHVRTRLTEAMSPLKLFEYLAGGAPVAAVDLAPIAAVEEKHVFLAPAGGDIVPAVARALADGRASEEERRAFLQRHSWEQRVDRILGLALAA